MNHNHNKPHGQRRPRCDYKFDIGFCSRRSGPIFRFEFGAGNHHCHMPPPPPPRPRSRPPCRGYVIDCGCWW